MKRLIFIIFFFPILAFAQVGISTTNPKASLDINGDLRIQNVPYSTSTNEAILVVDDSGYVKKSLIDKSTFRGYLSQNFTPDNDENKIYCITDFLSLEDLFGDFNTTTGIFTAPITGYYSIRMNITSKRTNDETSKKNAVFGLVELTDNGADKWVMRFSVPLSYIESVGTTSNSGVANSFIGVVKLEKDKKYYFGTTSHIIILSNPTGTTGTGLGTFFEIQLVKSE